MIGNIFESVLGIIDKIVPDKAASDKAKVKLIKLQQAGSLKFLEQQSNIIQTEMKGDSWLQRNWRPVTMITFVFIIANNYILYPYLVLFWQKAPLIPLPPDMWKLLDMCMGGYIFGRSGEKIVKSLKNHVSKL